MRAWLAREDWISDRTRRFAKCSAICSFALGMPDGRALRAGQRKVTPEERPPRAGRRRVRPDPAKQAVGHADLRTTSRYVHAVQNREDEVLNIVLAMAT
jgi:hypothetical protein